MSVKSFKHNVSAFAFAMLACLAQMGTAAELPTRPNIVLVMADDMGWGQTGYYNHPILKTPNLDAMAATGLRFDRFYAGAPNCSPTRATVMTGRTNDRTGVLNHGVPLRPQEITVAQMLSEAGYQTAHFGKWHLNGLRGPGVPVLGSDIRSPAAFGFQTWLSVTNFFDRNPLLSRMGTFEDFKGDSSEVVVDQALKFIGERATSAKPFFTVIWYGTPHSPFVAGDEDKAVFAELDKASANHYGELVAMDRSIGTLRKGLRDLNVANNTLVWFCSDNGGLPKITPETVGGLNGFKGSVYEGGLRVPAIIEWPSGISKPRITNYPACTMDILPTLVAIAAPQTQMHLRPLDGISLLPLFSRDIQRREQPIGFRHTDRTAWIDNNYKLLKSKPRAAAFELYDLEKDASETTNIIASQADVAKRMLSAWAAWNESVEASVAGLDYPEKKVIPAEPGPKSWVDVDDYKPWFSQWKNRPEFTSLLK